MSIQPTKKEHIGMRKTPCRSCGGLTTTMKSGGGRCIRCGKEQTHCYCPKRTSSASWFTRMADFVKDRMKGKKEVQRMGRKA